MSSGAAFVSTADQVWGLGAKKLAGRGVDGLI